MSLTKISLDAIVEIKTSTEEVISLKVQQIDWNAETPSCIMYGIINPAVWQKVWQNSLFKLSPEVAVHEPQEFEPEGDITLELALEPAILSLFLTKADPLEAFLYGLGGTTEASSKLLQSSSWRAYSVMQQIAVPTDPEALLQIGFKTVWAENKSDTK